MGRRLATGFELANVYGGSGPAGITRSAARCGFYGYAQRRASSPRALQFDGLEGNTSGTTSRLLWNFGVRTLFRVRRLPTAEAELMSVTSNQFGTAAGVWTIDENGIIRFYSVGSALPFQIAESDEAVVPGQWYRYHFGYLHGAEAPGGPGTLPPPCGVNIGLSLYSDSLNTRLWGTSLNSFTDGIPITGMGSISLGFSLITYTLGQTGVFGDGVNFDLEVDWDDVEIEDFADSTDAQNCNTNYFGPGIPSPSQWAQDFAVFESEGGCVYPLIAPFLGTVANWDVASINQLIPGYAGHDLSAEDPISTTALSLLTLIAPPVLLQGLVAIPRAVSVGVWNPDGTTPSVRQVMNLQTTPFRAMSDRRAATFPQPGVASASLGNADPMVFGVQKDNDATSMRAPFLGIELATPDVVLAPATVFGTPLFGIVVSTGQYTGNGTFQYIYLGWTPNWVSIFPQATNGGEGLIWHDGMMLPHPQTKQYNYGSEFYPAPGGFVVRKTTQSVANNDTVGYRYIAIRDGQQFGLFRGSFAFDSNEAAARTVEAMDPFIPFPSFVPELAWAHIEAPNGSTSMAGYVRGPGHSGVNSSEVIGGAAVTNAIRSLPVDCQIEIGQALKSRNPGTAWTAWAKNGFAVLKLWDIVSYTGDGNATQVIPVDLDGGTPVLTYVFPGTGTTTTFVKTPDDAGAAARQMQAGGTSNTAITAVGPDSVTVGSTLNTLGTVYNVLAIRSGFDLAQQLFSVVGSGGLVVGGGDVELEQGSGDAGWGGGGTGLGICGDVYGNYAPWGQTTPR